MKKIEKAVAIRYDMDKDGAPRVIAKGVGEVAQKIMAIGKEQDIPTYKDANLINALGTMEVGEEIPLELYEVMAKVLTFVYQIKEEAGKRKFYPKTNHSNTPPYTRGSKEL